MAVVLYLCQPSLAEERMSCEDQIIETLKESGYRPTPQRMMILSALRHAPGHVTAGEVLEQVKESYSFIDLSTVYRTLDMLKQMRLVSETHMGGDQHSYEWIDQVRHHHLVCQGCNGVELLGEEMLRSLGDSILETHGFKVDIDHLAVFGQCRLCRESSEGSGR